MATTAQQLSAIQEKALNRHSPNTEELGQVTRSDISEVLELYKNHSNEKQNVKGFLDGLPFVTNDMKNAILSDLGSYDVTYERT